MERPATGVVEREATLTVPGILQRCADRYAGMRTLEVRGQVRDSRRPGDTIETPVVFEYERPVMFRMQFGRAVVVILDDTWWMYDAANEVYRPRRAFDRTPVQTATFLASDGLSFLTPAVLERGARAFGGPDTRELARWTLAGVEWMTEVPCYVVERSSGGGSAGNRLKVWIDQDEFLIRGWAVGPAGLRATENSRTGGRRVALECIFDHIAVDQPLRPDRFSLNPPDPIETIVRSTDPVTK